MGVVTSHALLIRAAGLVAAVILLAIADGRDALGQPGGRDRQPVVRDRQQSAPPAVRDQSPVVRDHRGSPKQAPPGKGSRIGTDPAKARECTTTRISCHTGCRSGLSGKISQEEAKRMGACNMACNEREKQCVAKAKFTIPVEPGRDHRKR